MRTFKRTRKLSAVVCAIITLLCGKANAENSGQVATNARSAVILEQTTGKVLLANNAHEKLSMASTTKVMTALLALENGNLDDVVIVGRNAYGVPGTSIYLALGEQITLRDLLYGLMLASGNDAAVAIAEHIGGSVEKFCAMMTARAQEIGCENTVFLTPHGLPREGHYTTAYDLALIAREAMMNAAFREIVSTQRASIPWEGRSYHRILQNKNRLLSEYEGATGIKTGYTKAAGRCLVFGAQRDMLEVTGVLLNCPEWFTEAEKLMNTAFDRYEMFTAFTAGENVRVLPVENGKQETVCIRCADALAAPVPRDSVPDVEIDLPDTVSAGGCEGETAGEARLVLNGETLAKTSLVLGRTLAKRDYAFEVERMLRHWPMYPQTIGE